MNLNEQEIARALGKIEGILEGHTQRFDAVDVKLAEIKGLDKRIGTLETRSNRLIGALGLAGLLWSALVALVVKVWKN